MPWRRNRESSGFSLVEVLLSLLITLVVMGLVIQTSRDLASVYRNQSRSVEASAAATRAFDDIITEIARSGYGIGEGSENVAASLPGEPPSSGSITLRTNPDGIAAALTEDIVRPPDVPVASTDGFEPGDMVLLTDSSGVSERAEVSAKADTFLRLRSLDNPDGTLGNLPSARRGARVVKLREVRYYLQPDRDGNVLLKQVLGTSAPTRILARRVETLRFDYLDGFGNPLTPASLDEAGRMSVVKITMRFSMGTEGEEARTLSTAVAFDAQSASVDFAEPGYGFRLVRVFHPIAGPAGVASRRFSDWGVIVSGGRDRTRDRSNLFTFLLRERFLESRVDDVVWLEDVREPVAVAFGPEESPLAGSLFIASSGLRVGHLTRVHPDTEGGLSAESKVTTFERTESLAQIGGIVFGIDRRLYIVSAEKATLFRYHFDEKGEPVGPESLAKLEGGPSAMVRGTDGSIYFLLEQIEGSTIWKIPFDEDLAPGEPIEVGSLPGRGLSLAVEPSSGSLFALVEERLGDSLIVELTRGWLRDPSRPTTRVFSLKEFRDQTQAGNPRRSSRDEDPSIASDPSRLSTQLVPERLDFVAFDDFGLLYVGAVDRDLVLKFDLGRPDDRHEVEVAGVAVEWAGVAQGALPNIKVHAWRKRPFR